MAENTPSNYLRWITPTVGDPTYTLLKAHLLFEELLNAYLRRVLLHPTALDGARLTFAQTLAVAKAASPHVQSDHWIWQAISQLNRLRNMLSHEAQPKNLGARMKDYVQYVVQNTNVALPQSRPQVVAGTSQVGQGHVFTAADMVTLDLYYSTVLALGFSLSEINSGNGSAYP